MARAGAILVIALALAGCNPGDPSNGPYAPGIAPSGTSVDGLTVGHRMMRAGEHELALEAFTRAASEHGITPDILAALGSANLALGRLGQSEDLLRDAIESEDAVPETWNNLGVVLMERGKTAEASRIFRHAYAIDNGESDAIRDNLRLALAKLENPGYVVGKEQDYKLVRRGSSDYLIRKIP